MLFHWIRIILINKYSEFLILTNKINSPEKSALSPLGWSETRKIEIHPPHVLPQSKIHPTCISPELEYAWTLFNPPARLTGLIQAHEMLKVSKMVKPISIGGLFQPISNLSQFVNVRKKIVMNKTTSFFHVDI